VRWYKNRSEVAAENFVTAIEETAEVLKKTQPGSGRPTKNFTEYR
jgi:hypothetical protein